MCVCVCVCVGGDGDGGDVGGATKEEYIPGGSGDDGGGGGGLVQELKKKIKQKLKNKAVKLKKSAAAKAEKEIIVKAQGGNIDRFGKKKIVGKTAEAPTEEVLKVGQPIYPHINITAERGPMGFY